MKKEYLFLLTVLTLALTMICSSAFVSAISPVLEELSNQNNGVDIKYPNVNYIKQNTDYEFNWHLFNKTDGNPITNDTFLKGGDPNCSFHLYNQTGSHILTYWLNNILDYDNHWDYHVLVNGNNFSKAGIYSYIFQCNTSRGPADRGIGGYVDNTLEVTETGFENPDGSLSYAIILCLALVIAFLIIIAFLFKDKDIIKYPALLLAALMIISMIGIAVSLADLGQFGIIDDIVHNYYSVYSILIVAIGFIFGVWLIKWALEYFSLVKNLRPYKEKEVHLMDDEEIN